MASDAGCRYKRTEASANCRFTIFPEPLIWEKGPVDLAATGFGSLRGTVASLWAFSPLLFSAALPVASDLAESATTAEPSGRQRTRSFKSEICTPPLDC